MQPPARVTGLKINGQGFSEREVTERREGKDVGLSDVTKLSKKRVNL